MTIGEGMGVLDALEGNVKRGGKGEWCGVGGEGRDVGVRGVGVGEIGKVDERLPFGRMRRRKRVAGTN